jgi:hypothetical protein
MSKLRSDSAWAGLSPEQRETLEGWLFEENLGYKEALERAQKEFGLTASLTSLADYYQRLAQERMQRELRGIKSIVGEIDKATVDGEELGATAMTLVAKRMIQLAVESPGKVREMVSLGRLLVANQAQDIKRQWLEIEWGKIEDADREKFDQMESNLRLQENLTRMAENHFKEARRKDAKVSPEEPSI